MIKRMIVILLFSFPLHAFWGDLSVFSKNEDNKCKVMEKYEVSNPPKLRRQGGLGFCYGMAAASVLDHHICKTQKMSCDDYVVSSVDLIVSEKQGKMAEGGDLRSAIFAIADRGSVAKESCAPYNDILSKRKFAGNSDEEAMGLLKEIYLSRNYDPCKQDSIAKINELVQLKNDATEIVEALKKESFEEFLASLAIPKACDKQHLKLPPFNIPVFVKPTEEKVSPNWVRKRIAEVLKKDTPALVSYCSNKDCSVGHAVAVYGYQVSCCKFKGKESCNGSYILHDSMYSNPTVMSSSDLENRMIQFDSKVNLKSKDGQELFYPIHFLEPKNN